MITQIEIDGFKTFKDFKVELAPFQVIVGPNGSGKSNLFDALYLLARLMEDDLPTAFQKVRGYTNEIFTRLPGERSLDRMKLAVEMLINRQIQDDFGGIAELKYTRLRYEIELALNTDTYGLDRLSIIREELKSIPPEEDQWCAKYGVSASWIPNPGNGILAYTFIDTRLDAGKKPIIHLFHEEHPYEARGSIAYQAEAAQRTILSSVTGIIGSPHAFAARKELSSLKFLHLNPEALREPGPAVIHPSASLSRDGGNLATTLARIEKEDSFAFHCISLDMANLVPGILEIRLEKRQASNEYDIWAETRDHSFFSAQTLSDGTLRLLALTTMKNDPQFHGVLCLEEPENGVDPLYLKQMKRLLDAMVTDFEDTEQVDEPLRQLLITTHSPIFLSLPGVIDCVLFAFRETLVDPHHYNIEVTRMIPVITPRKQLSSTMQVEISKAEENYILDQVKALLNSKALENTEDQIEQARATFNER